MTTKELVFNGAMAGVCGGAAVWLQLKYPQSVFTSTLILLAAVLTVWLLRKRVKRHQLVTPEVYIKYTTPRPCGAARLWLLEYPTVQHAWLSDSVFPEFMLWAVCVHRGVSNAELTRMIKRLVAAGLTSWKSDVDIGDKRYDVGHEALHVQGAERYCRAPSIEWCVGETGECKLSLPVHMAQQRRIMREEFPRLFGQSIAQFRQEQAGPFKPD